MKKLSILILVVMLTVVGSVFATNDWKSTNTTTNWFTATNWSSGVVPDLTAANGDVRLYQTNAASFMPDINVGQIAQAYEVRDGGQGSGVTPYGRLTMDGGSLTTANWLMVGVDSASNRWGEFYMNSGSVILGTGTRTNGHLYIGYGNGTLNVTGWMYMTNGSIDAGGLFCVDYTAYANGYVNMSGGSIVCNQFKIKNSGGTTNVAQVNLSGNAIVTANAGTSPFYMGGGMLNISNNAKVIVNGDVTTLVQGYIDNGWITGNVRYDYNVSNAGKTTLYVPEPATICLLGLGLLVLIRRK